MTMFRCTTCGKPFRSLPPPAETRADDPVKLCAPCIDNELDAIDAPPLDSETIKRAVEYAVGRTDRLPSGRTVVRRYDPVIDITFLAEDTKMDELIDLRVAARHLCITYLSALELFDTNVLPGFLEQATDMRYITRGSLVKYMGDRNMAIPAELAGNDGPGVNIQFTKGDKIELPTLQDNPDGLHNRYQVTRADGQPLDDGVVLFVLRLDNGCQDKRHRQACYRAAESYIDTVEGCGDEKLERVGRELETLLDELEAETAKAEKVPE